MFFKKKKSRLELLKELEDKQTTINISMSQAVLDKINEINRGYYE